MSSCRVCGGTGEDTIEHQEMQKCRKCIAEYEAGKQGIDSKDTSQSQEPDPELEYDNNLF
jgi:hypothetical protein